MISFILLAVISIATGVCVWWWLRRSHREVLQLYEQKRKSLLLLSWLEAKVGKTRDAFSSYPKDIDPYIFDVYIFEIRGIIALMGDGNPFYERQISIAEDVKNQLVDMIHFAANNEKRPSTFNQFFYSQQLYNLFTLVHRIEKRINL